MSASDSEAALRGQNLDPAPAERGDRTFGPPTPRACGRCRREFPGDGALNPSAAPPWSVCTPCRIALFGDGSHPHMSSRWATSRTSIAALVGEGVES